MLKDQLRLVSTFGQGSATGDSGPVAHLVYFNNVESMYDKQPCVCVCVICIGFVLVYTVHEMYA